MNGEPGKFVRGAVAAVVLFPMLVTGQQVPPDEIIHSGAASFRLEQVADGLQVPWAIAFLPGNRALISERAAGRIGLVDLADGTLAAPAGGPDDVFIKDNGGMLDVVLHPAFDDNGWVYYCYTAGDLQLSTTVVERVRLTEGRLRRIAKGCSRHSPGITIPSCTGAGSRSAGSTCSFPWENGGT